MPKTYYDSELTGAQIESALEAIHGVVTPSNNGKVLCIVNGAIAAKSASEWGHGAVLEPLSVTANGDYTPPTGVDGFDEVHVAVPGATLTTKSITANGTYNASQDNADGYSSVTVAVPGGATIESLEVTQNGTYNPPSGVDGFAPVTVNVSGGGDDPFALTNYIESSGTQWIDTGYVPKQNSSYRFVATFLSGNPVYSMIIGARDIRDGAGGNPVIFGPGNSSFQIGWGTRTLTTGISSTPFFGLKGIYNFDKDGYDASTESKRPSGYGAFSGGEPLTTNSLYLFSLNAAGSEYGEITRCKAKLYRFCIFESGVLVHEFIPWQENGVACLKDTVTSEIKYNAGTGNFVYGTDA